MNPADIPAAMTGVWDSTAVSTPQWEGEDYTLVECFLHGTKTVEAMAIADPARVDAITVTGSPLSVTVDSRKVAVGASATCLAHAPGINEMQGTLSGSKRLEWRGVTIYVDADTVSALSIGE